MGMFDDVICEYPLPLPENPRGYKGSKHFQTKDLENTLSKYEIRENGTLWVKNYLLKYHDGDPNGKTFAEKAPRSEVIEEWYDRVKYDGDLRIYDYQQTNGGFDYDIEYIITFRRYKVKKVVLSSFNAHCNKSRLKKQEEYEKELKRIYEFKQTKRYRYFYSYYNKVTKYIVRSIIKLIDGLKSILDKIQNKLYINI